MSATGVDVFDKTLQTTNIWLHDRPWPDRRIALHILGAVLRTLRDRLQVGLAAKLGAELPLRGAYYDRYRPAAELDKTRSLVESLHIAEELKSIRPVDPEDAARSVFRVPYPAHRPRPIGEGARCIAEENSGALA